MPHSIPGKPWTTMPPFHWHGTRLRPSFPTRVATAVALALLSFSISFSFPLPFPFPSSRSPSPFPFPFHFLFPFPCLSFPLPFLSLSFVFCALLLLLSLSLLSLPCLSYPFLSLPVLVFFPFLSLPFPPFLALPFLAHPCLFFIAFPFLPVCRIICKSFSISDTPQNWWMLFLAKTVVSDGNSQILLMAVAWNTSFDSRTFGQLECSWLCSCIVIWQILQHKNPALITPKSWSTSWQCAKGWAQLRPPCDFIYTGASCVCPTIRWNIVIEVKYSLAVK